jgi:hypothetical protein
LAAKHSLIETGRKTFTRLSCAREWAWFAALPSHLAVQEGIVLAGENCGRPRQKYLKNDGGSEETAAQNAEKL